MGAQSWGYTNRFFFSSKLEPLQLALFGEFGGHGHGMSQADSSLQCRIRSRVWDLLSGCTLFVGFALFSLEVHAFHGADSLFYLVFLFCLIDCHIVA